MEKRQRARLEHPVMVAYRSVDRFIADLGTNVSGQGVFVNTRAPLPVGAEVRLLLSIPGRPEPYEIVGRVARVQSAAEGDPGMGIVFTDLDEAERARLDALLTALRERLA